MSISTIRPTGTFLSTAALLALLLVGTAGCTGAGKAVGTPSLATTEQVCSSCHGRDGNSVSPMFPRLAGQQHDYLVSQLKALRDHSRGDREARTYMWGMAARLDDASIDALATAYAGAQPQPASAPDSAAETLALGEAIYTKGVGKADDPVCAACHGEGAQGMDAVPRLAGQHKDYIVRQLAAYASGERENEMMHDISKDLNDSQRDALASYLATR